MKLLTIAAIWLVYAPAAVPATAVYAVTRSGSLYRSTDAAKSWQQIPLAGVTASTYSSAVAIDPQDPAKIYVALYDKGTATGKKARAYATSPVKTLFRSTDGGQSWLESALPENVLPTQLLVDPASPATVYLVTGATLYRSIDSGATFTAATLNLAVTGITPDPTHAGVVYAVALDNRRNSILYKSTDSGSTWTAGSTIGLPNTFLNVVRQLALDPSNGNNLFVATGANCPSGVTNCSLIRSSDGGKTWQNEAVAGDFWDVAIDRNGTIYASGLSPASGRTAPAGHVVKSTDGGKTWTSLDTGLSTYPVKVLLDPNVNSTLYAVLDAASGYTATGPLGLFVSVNGAAWAMNAVAAPGIASDVILGVEATSGAPGPPAPPAPTGSVSRTVSAASLQDGPVAAESIVIATGARLATDSATANYDQPPNILAGTKIDVTDSAGVTRPAALFKVSPTQVTYQIPPGTAAGAATVTITAGDGLTATSQLQVAAVAPGVYTLNAAALAKGYALRVSNGNEFVEDLFEIDLTGAVIAHPITISNGDQVYLVVYGTGFRAAGGDIGATIGGIATPLLYAGPQGVQPGLDQFNVLIPPELGTGTAQVVQIVLTASGQTANTVNITVQ